MSGTSYGLTPDTAERGDALLRAAAARGWSLRVASSIRTCAEQNRLYAQSRTTPGPHVTDARGCQSWHVLGRAVDLAFVGMPPQWGELGALGKSLGFKWGGDFPGFPDVGHFEYHPGLTIEDVCPRPEECIDMAQAGEWMDPGCGQGPRVRWTGDGYIELEGEGIRKAALDPRVLGWSDLIHASAAKYGIPPMLVAGIMGLESQGNDKAVSPAQAYGLMQLIVPTATSMAGRSVSREELLSNPALNVDLGCKLLGILWQKTGGNPIKIGFSYNAGGVRCGAGCKRHENGQCVERCKPNRFNILADCVNPTSPDSFTVDYATRIISFANTAKDTIPPPKGGGSFSDIKSVGSFSGLTILGGAVFGLLVGVGVALYQRGHR